MEFEVLDVLDVFEFVEVLVFVELVELLVLLFDVSLLVALPLVDVPEVDVLSVPSDCTISVDAKGFFLPDTYS